MFICGFKTLLSNFRIPGTTMDIEPTYCWRNFHKEKKKKKLYSLKNEDKEKLKYQLELR